MKVLTKSMAVSIFVLNKKEQLQKQCYLLLIVVNCRVFALFPTFLKRGKLCTVNHLLIS